MTTPQIIAVSVFVIVMAVIATEKVHRTLVALAGAVLLVILGVMPVGNAMGHVDFNTIGVLLGMMLFVAVVKTSGLFEYLAIKAAKIAKGDPWKLMVSFAIITFFMSAMLDNVTTVLLVGPMTLTICRLLDIDPIPYFMVEIMSSNIGGTSTLIGDPPNIMIGSAAGLSFLDFVKVDFPVVAVVMVVVLILFKFIYGRNLKADEGHRMNVMSLDENESIKDARVFKQSVVMIILVTIAFMIHGALGLESSVIALSAAAILMLISRCNVEKTVMGVEWATIGFFIGLFVIVGSLSETGIIGALANWLMTITAGQTMLTMIILLWASAIISSILDNIPFVATLIPIILTMEASGVDVAPLWWAISLGACLGGNGTLIGASANVVLSGISNREGYPLTFMSYLKVGFPLMIVAVVICTGYLLLRFHGAA